MNLENLRAVSDNNFRIKYLIPVALIGMIFLIKLLQVLWLSSLSTCATPVRSLGNISMKSGDSFSYTGAMENLIQHGDYYFKHHGERISAGRLPHYAVPYWLARQFLPQAESYDLVVLLQVLLEAIGIFFISSLLFQMTGNRYVPLLLALFLILSTRWTSFSYVASPESFSTSFLCLFIYQYFQYLNNRQNTALLWSGVFLGLLVCLKPYFGLIYLILGVHFVLPFLKRPSNHFNWTAVLKNSLTLSLPLIVLLTPWTARNLIKFNRFIPLQESLTAGYQYNSADFAVRQFISAWGGDFIYWEKTSAGCYFMPNPRIACEFSLPSRALSDGYSAKQVADARNQYVLLQTSYSKSLDEMVTASFNRLTESYRSERPLMYYVISPIILVKKFLTHSGSYYLPIHSTNPCYKIYQFLIKLLQSALYWGSLLGGIVGLVYMTIKEDHAFIVSMVPISLIVLFPILLRAVEWRYFQHSYPILGFATVYLIYQVYNRMRPGN